MSWLNNIPVKGLGRIEVEQAAKNLIKQVAPEYLITPGAIPVNRIIDIDMFKLYQFNLQLLSTHEFSPGTEAETDFFNRKILFSDKEWARLDLGNVRSRSTAAHEIGHIVLHSKQINLNYALNNLRLQRKKQIKPKAYESPEWQAYNFAGAFLMPAITVIPFVVSLKKSNYDHSSIVEALIEKYHVSKQTATKRLEILKTLELKGTLRSLL